MKLLWGLLLTSLLFSQELNWHKHDYKGAVKDAKITQKPLMIMFSQWGCRACIWMKESVIARDDIQDYLAKHYILAMIDIKEDTIPEGFKVEGTPMFYFQDAKGNSLHKRIIGGKKPDYFLKLLKRVNKKK
jgi:thioredoxin-related protein